MFGLEFLFGWALLALPLAGLPIILHLLFRRKSQVVSFSTLRFIKSSIQRTAARRRVHRWWLLALRVLAILLLIWAVAQPATRLAAQWAGQSSVAAVVLDTSYSMTLTSGDQTLLDRANETYHSLLENELRGASVAVFRSDPARTDTSENFVSASQRSTAWVAERTGPAPVPLSERVKSASTFLETQDAKTKWLIVLSDLQATEFSRPLPESKADRLSLFDFHPDKARSTGITRVELSPAQAMPGVQSEVIVEVTGEASSSRAVTVELGAVDGTRFAVTAPQMASIGEAGRTRLRFPIDLPARRFVRISATLSSRDDMAWDDSRSLLVEVPPRRKVRLLDSPDAPLAGRFVRLALDPNEGRLASWPVELRHGGDISPDDDAIVTIFTHWPDLALVTRLRDMARSGKAVLLIIQPGLETNWAALSAAQRIVLSEILPGEPTPTRADDRPVAVLVPRPDDAIFQGLLQGGRLESVSVSRAIVFANSPTQVVPLLASASRGQSSGAPDALLARRAVGAGQVFTLGTLPEPRFTNLATSPVFLPLLVRATLADPQADRRRNVDIGEPIVCATAPRSSADAIRVETPAHEVFVIAARMEKDKSEFVFDKTTEPGIYTWLREGSDEPIDVSNVQVPPGESELTYRSAEATLSPQGNWIVARSLDDFRTKLRDASEPQARWSWAVAAVLFLLCLEALAASAGSKQLPPASALTTGTSYR